MPERAPPTRAPGSSSAPPMWKTTNQSIVWRLEHGGTLGLDDQRYAGETPPVRNQQGRFCFLTLPRVSGGGVPIVAADFVWFFFSFLERRSLSYLYPTVKFDMMIWFSLSVSVRSLLLWSPVQTACPCTLESQHWGKRFPLICLTWLDLCYLWFTVGRKPSTIHCSLPSFQSASYTQMRL